MLERDQRVLNNMKVVARATLPLYVAEHVEADVFYDRMYDQVAYQLRSIVLAERIGDREYPVQFSYPASWWQHFKRDVLPTWFMRRWPVKTKTETKVVYAQGYRGYPNAPIALPAARMGQSVVFEMFSTYPDSTSNRDAQ